ncbi:MAG: hypothetical protein JWP74_2932, partial [Marmoricola sp.]|nr:hypothetical protein [Marmoricola sp.]
PPPTTPPTTPPVTPVETASDVNVRLSFKAGLGLLAPATTGTLGNITAQVGGVPTGTTSMLTLKILGGTLTELGTGCAPVGDTAVCEIGPDAPPITFKVIGVPVSAMATVTTPSTVVDPDANNNQDSMLLGLL